MKIFFAGMLWFVSAFIWLLMNGGNSEILRNALLASAIVIVSSGGVYALGACVTIRSSTGIAASKNAQRVLFWLSLSISFAGVATFLWFVKTTSSFEIIKSFFDPGGESSLTEVELRLSTGLMPMWVQVLFEVTRRFALPLCAMMFFVMSIFEKRNWLVGASIVVLSAICILGTLDRGIPLLFIALLYGSYFFYRRINPIKDRWLYISVFAAIAFVGGFKSIQYGEVRQIHVTENPFITRYLSPNSPEARSSIHNPDFQAGARPSNTVDDTIHGPIDYAKYMLTSISERVALSPVVMTLYAFDQYNENNFLHWSSNRIFSLLGMGHYVTPFETSKNTTYHDAFPVTFLGDVWRNSGLYGMPFFGALLGLLLVTIDRTFFRKPPERNDLSPIWKAFCVLGVAYLFYGNALNATTTLLIGGSFGCTLFLWLFAKAQSGTQVTPRGEQT